jgi:hypothetical protein
MHAARRTIGLPADEPTNRSNAPAPADDPGVISDTGLPREMTAERAGMTRDHPQCVMSPEQRQALIARLGQEFARQGMTAEYEALMAYWRARIIDAPVPWGWCDSSLYGWALTFGGDIVAIVDPNPDAQR